MCDDTPRADDPPSRVPIVRARLRARGQPRPRARPDKPTPPRPQAACPPPELLRRRLLGVPHHRSHSHRRVSEDVVVSLEKATPAEAPHVILDRRRAENGEALNGWVFPTRISRSGRVTDLSHMDEAISRTCGEKFRFHGLHHCFITVAERDLLLPLSLTKRLVNHARPSDLTDRRGVHACGRRRIAGQGEDAAPVCGPRLMRGRAFGGVTDRGRGRPAAIVRSTGCRLQVTGVDPGSRALTVRRAGPCGSRPRVR